ncbi:MAG: EpsG family protein, partial [Pseudomonadota bacterium]
MYPYFILIGLPAFFGLFTNRQTQGGIGLLFVLVIFTGLIGLRYDIGPDWFAYTMQAERLPVMPFGELVAQGEFGWSLVAIICDQLGLGVQGLAFISALVFVAGVVAVARSVEEPMLAVIAAVPYLSIAVAMSGMRQATAMGIIFIAVGFWYRLPLWGRIALILFASTFHFTALALLFVVALEADLKPIAKGAAAAAVFVIVLYFVTVTDFRIDRYAENYFGEGGAANAEGAFLHVALTGVPCIVYFMFRGRWIE